MMPPVEKEDTRPVAIVPQYRMRRKTPKTEEAIGIFLDIDGVLLPLPTLMDRSYKDLAKEMFPGENLNMQHYIAAKVNAFSKSALESLDRLILTIIFNRKKPLVVLSSNWRKNLSVEELRIMFKQHNFSKYIVDKTPDTVNESEALDTRGNQIDYWLTDNRAKYNLTDFVALDDNDDGVSQVFAWYRRENRFIFCQRNFGMPECKKAMSVLGLSEIPQEPFENKHSSVKNTA